MPISQVKFESTLPSKQATTPFDLYFRFNKWVIKKAEACGMRIMGLVISTLFLEGISSFKATIRRIQYRKDPIYYGFNQIKPEHVGKSPIIILHGIMGKWTDLAPLAKKFKEKNIPVFALNLLNPNMPNEIDRQRIHDEAKRIQDLYRKVFPGKETPLIDLVGHSNGGAMAVTAIFTSESTMIKNLIEKRDWRICGRGDKEPEKNLVIGRVFSLAQPTPPQVIRAAEKIGKVQDLYNINAKYDAIVGEEECGLSQVMPSHVVEMNTGHLGILNVNTAEQVVRFLQV